VTVRRSSSVDASNTAILSGNVTTTDLRLARTSLTGFLNLILFTYKKEKSSFYHGLPHCLGNQEHGKEVHCVNEIV
jgi:hypothetical protein